jgi:hypothetical protein
MSPDSCSTFDWFFRKDKHTIGFSYEITGIRRKDKSNSLYTGKFTEINSNVASFLIVNKL